MLGHCCNWSLNDCIGRLRVAPLQASRVEETAIELSKIAYDAIGSADMGKLLKGLLLVLLLGTVVAVVLYGRNDHQSRSQQIEYSRDKRSKKDQPLFCQNRNVDFGHIYRPVTKSVEHSYTIENTSSKPVELRIASKSCACAKAELTRTFIRPEEVAELQIAWKVSSQPGQQNFGVFVETLPSGSGGIEVGGTIFVRDHFVVEPQEISFGDIKPGQAKTRRFLVQAPSGQNLPAGLSCSIEANHGNELRVTRIQASDYKMTFDVSISGQTGQGQKHCAVIIVTGDPVQPEIQIPVSVNHLDVCQVQPAIVMFSKAQNGKEPKWVTVVSNTDSPVMIQKVVVDKPSLVGVQIQKSDSINPKLGLYVKDSHQQKEPCTGAVTVFITGAAHPVTVRYLYLDG